VATALEGFANLPEFVRGCAERARAAILASPRPEALAKKLEHGREDVGIALEIDRFADQRLALGFVDERFAEVRKA
jgi:hypothetical protein